MACKITVSIPETDSFVITDSKGKPIMSKITINMIPDSAYCLFVQKKANIGIVPEDKISITGGKKAYNVILKPAVSLVSLEELENAASQQDTNESVDLDEEVEPPQSTRSLDSDRSRRSRIPVNSSTAEDDQATSNSQDEYEPKQRVSRIRPPTKRPSNNNNNSKAKQTSSTGNANDDDNNNSFEPMKRVKKPIELKKVDPLEFSASDFQMPQLAEDEEPVSATTPHKTAKNNNNNITKSAKPQRYDKEQENNSAIPMPKVIEQSPVKKSQIPVAHHRPDLPPDADVLERSLHVKFSFTDDAFSKPPQKSNLIKWYDDDAFDNLEEPDFSFELMMVGEGEDPVFCIDGDYYDSSGRMLSVQQGKGKVVFVTEDGYDEADVDNYNDENY